MLIICIHFILLIKSGSNVVEEDDIEEEDDVEEYLVHVWDEDVV